MIKRDPDSQDFALFSIKGMTCSGCARKVTEVIEGLAGVDKAQVDLDAGRAKVSWDAQPNTQLADQITAAVQAAGFEAILEQDESTTTPGWFAKIRESLSSGWLVNLWIAGPVFIFLLISEWFLPFSEVQSWKWIAFALATPVQILCGSKFYLGAWRQAKVGRYNMDTLVSLGSTAAYGYSTWSLFSGSAGHMYFMDSAGILFLISFGHWLESRMNKKASSSLKALMNLAPDSARVLDASGSLKEVPVSSVQKLAHIQVRAGERIPLDGEITEGTTSVDESMITGESVPARRTPGSKVIGGTMNLNKTITVKVTAVGKDTVIARILNLVEKAQANKANIQRLGDRVSNIFVPSVLGLASITLLVWGLAPEWANNLKQTVAPWLTHDSFLIQNPWSIAILNATAVLIIACPCAMGLATPVALMAGTSLAARNGIFIRDAVALEKSGRIDALIFDKTGTLTTQDLSMDELRIDPDSGMSEPFFIQIARALASHSNHPASRAIAGDYSDASGFEDVEEHPGLGLSARHKESGKTYRLGSRSFLESEGLSLSPSLSEFHEQASADGASVILLAEDKIVCGAQSLTTRLKTGIKDVMNELKARSLKIYLLTGDRHAAALHAARQAGIDEENVFADVRPDEKADKVRELQNQGHRVGFVGDGINDAPALRQADLGIAVTQANDIAKEAADIILIKSDIDAVPLALNLSRDTLRTIKQNLFWAFFYNALGIPIAMMGLISPILCAAAMGMSDLVVIGNALRLKHRKP